MQILTYLIRAIRTLFNFLKLPWLYLTVLKTNDVNFYINWYPKVLQFCEITPSKSPGNYWQKISENNKKTFVIHTKVAASNSVFPRHCFSFKSARVISLSGVQLSWFIHLFHVKTAIFDIVFWSFDIIVFFVFIENTNNWMFQVCNQNPRLQFRSIGL